MPWQRVRRSSWVARRFSGASYLGSTRSGTIVISQFSGFDSPVGNPPVVNTANACRSIPVKFGLGGNRGLDIFRAGYPKAVAVSCATGAPIATIAQVAPATSSLAYDPTTQRYTYTWTTSKSFAGRCYKLRLGLVDGSDRTAIFRFE